MNSSVEMIVRSTIKKFKLEAVDFSSQTLRKGMLIKSVNNIDWQKLLGNGRDIIEVLRTTQDSLKLRSFILKRLDRDDIEISEKISLLSQLIFLLEQEDKTELAYSLASHLSKLLPGGSADGLLFKEIADELCKKLKHSEFNIAA